MICKKCGKDMQEARFCPDCGEPGETAEQVTDAQPKKKLNGKILAVGAACAAAAVAVGAFFIFKPDKPENRVERTVNEVYEAIQDELIDPASLQLTEMYIQFYEDDEGKYGANVYAEFSAGTQGGGVRSSDAIVYIHEDGENSASLSYSDAEVNSADAYDSVAMSLANYLVADTKLKIVQDPEYIKLTRSEINDYLD